MERTNILSTSDPVLILVHGALTDASIWHPVIARLHSSGHTVLAPALPMRSLEQDAAYLAAVIADTGRPVVLAAHSYAGAVISHPAITATGAVRALVYVAAFQPDTGESVGELNAKFSGSLLTPDNLAIAPNPLGGQDLTLRPERFAEVYAGDLDPALAAVLAAAQRPIEPAALAETLPGEPAWRSIPSWALISTRDRSLPAQTMRFMAERAESRVTEVDSAHAVPAARPEPVAEVILDAARAIDRLATP
ncbi:alpha/beta fold hydrolase [Nocardia sp. NPDC060256]|uniref:alpha/beta fold hydrolase n=1 Tax=unclassified Nocardia TaxID=2637762 RepID=UPI003658911A